MAGGSRARGAQAIASLRSRSQRRALSRSEVMSRIRSKGTLPEKAIEIELKALGVRYRAHVSALPGTPDFANKTKRWAIFVHGCFWHAHEACRLAVKPKTNVAYWIPKLDRNKERDAQNPQ
ncbi:MAG: very short patch repair endonuclease [Terracidiphilus sp.]